jgi:hypothetical protein
MRRGKNGLIKVKMALNDIRRHFSKPFQTIRTHLRPPPV